MARNTIIAVSFILIIARAAYAEEIKLSTIIPNQTILRAQKGAVGSTYSNSTTLTDASIPTGGLVVEGNIGVGTSSPGTGFGFGNEIHVKGTGAGSANSAGLILEGQRPYCFTSDYQGAFHIYDYSSSADRVTISNGGIFTAYGSAHFEGNNIMLKSPVAYGSSWGFVVSDSNGGLSIGKASDPLPQGGSLNTTSIYIDPVNGKVTFPLGHADYVFAPDYNLMPLKELREYIGENKRLPRMSKEEGNDGSVNDLLTKLLEKTEEQALYILQLEDRISKLEKDNGNR